MTTGQTAQAVPRRGVKLRAAGALLVTSMLSAVVGMIVERSYSWTNAVIESWSTGSIGSVENLKGRCFTVSGDVDRNFDRRAIWIVSHRTGAGYYFSRKVNTDSRGNYKELVTAGSKGIAGSYTLILMAATDDFAASLDAKPDFPTLPRTGVRELDRHNTALVPKDAEPCAP